MLDASIAASPAAELSTLLRGVRLRWRLKLAVRGLALAAGVALATFLVAAWLLDRFDYAPGAVLAGRAALNAVVLVAVAWFLGRPLLRRVDRGRVALYVEEREPTLGAALLSAVEVAEGAGAAVSPELARRTVRAALERSRAVAYGRRIERAELQQFALALGGIVAVAATLGLVGPDFVRRGASALLDPFRPAAATAPYWLDVSPGNVTIPRGADQAVRARLHGWAARGPGGAARVELVVRSGRDSTFERLPMTAARDTSYEVLLFDVKEPTDYFVEADGIRSPVYRIGVAELPYVDRIDLEYHYPAYTGLPPRRVEDGGDVAALPGTTVRLRVVPTIPVGGGRIVLDDGASLPLTADSAGALAGAIVVRRPGTYQVELAALGGGTAPASPRYVIDVLKDEAPSIRFVKPGRDARVTNVEEVYLEARASDDVGVGAIELHYSVNGGPEKTTSLFRGTRALREVTAGQTLYLEEMGLKPGDLISYYATATDNDTGGGRKTATSDIYFLQVRPFGRDYKQAEQVAQPGGSDGDRNAGDLSGIQRQIIAATFNVIRDRASYTDKTFGENVTTIALSQEELRDQVRTLVQRMRSRGIVEDSSFREIAEILPQAVKEMEEAAGQLRARDPGAALPAEQRALQQLQRAEALYREVRVALQQNAGGGRGPSAEDLADLFELELDRMRNQYETVQQGERSATQDQVDETLEKLRELAQRQEQEAERLRRQAQSRQAAGAPGGGGSQRQMAEEAEEAARQLERLARESSRPQLEDVARQLREAADAMRRAASDRRGGGTAEARAALDRLREARRRLERDRSDAVQSGAREAARKAEALAQAEREIAAEMQRLGADAGRGERARRLIERKEQQAADVAELERELDRLAAAARGGQPDASRKLKEAANGIRDDQLRERILYSRALTQPGIPQEQTTEFEAQIASAIERLRDRMRQAQDAFTRTDEERTAESLERARDLVRGLESMEEQARARAEAARRDRTGGQPGAQSERSPGGARDAANAARNGARGAPGPARSAERGAPGVEGSRAQAGPPAAPADRSPGPSLGGEPGSPGSASPDGLGPDDARQFRSELRQRLQEARELRQRLSREGRDVAELDRVIAALGALDRPGVLRDPEQLAQLQAAVVEGAREFEYGLRRAILGDSSDRPLLSGTDEIPAQYRKLLEEYYRSLARNR